MTHARFVSAGSQGESCPAGPERVGPARAERTLRRNWYASISLGQDQVRPRADWSRRAKSRMRIPARMRVSISSGKRWFYPRSSPSSYRVTIADRAADRLPLGQAHLRLTQLEDTLLGRKSLPCHPCLLPKIKIPEISSGLVLGGKVKPRISRQSWHREQSRLWGLVTRWRMAGEVYPLIA